MFIQGFPQKEIMGLSHSQTATGQAQRATHKFEQCMRSFVVLTYIYTGA